MNSQSAIQQKNNFDCPVRFQTVQPSLTTITTECFHQTQIKNQPIINKKISHLFISFIINLIIPVGMGCSTSTQNISPTSTVLAQSRRNKVLSILPEKHQFHLRKQNPPHGTTSNSRITDLIVKNKQINNAEFKEAYSRAKQLHSKYCDPQFPATEQALGGSYKQSITWKSPEEFIEGDIQLLSENITIKQNKSVSNYFVSALLIALKHPEIVKRVFENIEVNKAGVYGIWLCVDSWRCFAIDDRIPTLENQPYFNSSGNDITIPLLEKAMAKGVKTYERIETGLFGVCFTNLTGCPYQYYNKSSKLEQNVDQMWDFINKQLDRDYIVVVSNEFNDRNQNMWGKSEYSYQILETTIIALKGDNKQKLLKVANPWKKYDWTGRWSLKSKTWTPDLKTKLNFNDSEEYFWINIEDLSQNFKQVCSCRYQKENIYSCCKLSFDVDKTNEFKGVFMTVDTKNKGYLTLTQKDHRAFDKNYKYGLVRLIVCEINPQDKVLIRYVSDYLDSAQHMSVELDLEIGNYYIAIECAWLDRARELVVSFYGSHGVVLLQDNDLPRNVDDFINEMIILHEKFTEKERMHKYAGDENISRVTGSVAGYVYYHYTNNSKIGRCLQETVLLKQRQFVKVFNQKSEQQFAVRVDPGEQIIVKLKVTPQGNGFYSYSTKIQFHIIESYSLQKLKQLCEKNPTKTKKREIDGKPIDVIVKTYSYSGGIAVLYLNKMDKYAFVEELTLQMDNLYLQNEVMNEKCTVDIEIEPQGYKLLSFLIDKPGQKVSFKTTMSFYLNTPEFQF